MYLIGELSKEFNLSRSTLLYYDSLGLLKPTHRLNNQYREYSEEDRRKLTKICTLREAGIPLNQIKDIIYSNQIEEGEILSARLYELNKEIKYLRLQQKIITEMLKSKNQSHIRMPFDSETFLSILHSLGFNDEALDGFHKQFEKNAPDSHQFFLEFLGLNDENIKIIQENT